MKNKLIIIMLCICSFNSFAQNADFEKANAFYMEEKYKEAEELYSSILNNGYESPALYFNLGNCYFRMGNYPYAMLNYERAKRLAPKDTDIATNINVTKAKLIDKFDEMPDIFFVKWWKTLCSLLNRDQWAYVFIGLMLIGFFLFACYALSSAYRSKLLNFYGGIFLFVLSAVSLSCAVFQNNMQTRNEAIVLKNKINVSSSPNADNQKFIINSGTKVYIMDEIKDYVRIRVADGSNGWIAKENIVLI